MAGPVTAASPSAVAEPASTSTATNASATTGPDEQEGRRERLLRVFGRVILGIGLFAALFVLYEIAFTPLTEENSQASLLSQFQQDVPTTTVDAPGASISEGSPVALMSIPNIGVTQVVAEGTTPSDLKVGPGHLMSSPLPGEAGNVVIAGHRTTYGGPFAKLDELGAGNIIKFDTGRGTVTYVVNSVKHVSPGAPDPILDTPSNRLTLITSDPAIFASGRLVVEASLIGLPLDVAHRAPVLVGDVDLGLTGDPLGLALGLIWAELLGLTVFLAWRYRHRWSPEVLYLLTAPIVLILAVLTFSSLDLMLPGTF
jgi:sortase A